MRRVLRCPIADSRLELLSITEEHRPKAGDRGAAGGSRRLSTEVMTRGRALPLLALITGFILYGSLHPFTFRPLPDGVALHDALVAAWRAAPVSRGDVLANLLLYAPFGLLVAIVLPGWRPAARIAAATAAAFLLSVSIEVAQLHDTGRTSSGWDVLCNTFGALIGAVLAGFGAARGLGEPPTVRDPVALTLLLAWFGYRLHPYLPSMDLQTWRDNLKPLLLTPVFEPVRTLALAAAWISVALLAEAALGRRAARLLVPLGMVGALAAEVLIPGKRLTTAEVVAVGFALPAATLLRGRSPTPAVMVAVMLGAVLAERLEPFDFSASREFGWLPFASLLGGSRDAGLAAILGKTFLFGSLLWWLLRAGARLPLATATTATVVLAGSLAQTRIPGRSAEITDTLLVLALALLIRAYPVTAPERCAASWRDRAAMALARRRRRRRRIA